MRAIRSTPAREQYQMAAHEESPANSTGSSDHCPAPTTESQMARTSERYRPSCIAKV